MSETPPTGSPPAEAPDAEPSAVDRLLERIESGLSRQHLAEALEPIHAADIADLLEELEEDEHIDAVVGLLDLEETADVIHEVRGEHKEELLEAIPDERLAEVLGEMEPDEAAAALDLIDEQRARAVLQQVEHGQASNIRALRGFEPETAGRVMTTEYLAVSAGDTVEEALAKARAEAEEIETLSTVMVVDKQGRLVALASIEDLIGAEAGTPVSEVMDRAVISVHAERDREVAAHMMEKYDLGVLPVTGDGGRLLGIITFDDVMAILEDEAEEDMYRMAGIGADDPLSEGVVRRANKRLPWLATTLIGGLLLAIIISWFQPTLKAIVALVSFFPVIMGLAGNVGIQSSTITVRGLATGEVDLGDVFWLLRREIAVGAMIGLVCAVIIGVAAHAFLGLNPERATGVNNILHFTGILSISCFFGILVGVVIGTAAPLLCHRMGVDPAVAAGPFVTVTVDVAAQILYLGFATLFLL